ncbi:MAG: inositol 2-dehydrogenase [Chloroflexota bacterium]
MSNSINFGIIGAGRIGNVHAESLVTRIPEANVLAISDVFEEAAQKTAERFHIAQATSNYRDILEDSRVDAVAICSSTDTHTQFIIEAAQAGKHIFCEKPIALDLAAIDSALNVVEENGVKLQIGFNRRFDANFAHLRDVVASGKIGEPHSVRIISRDPAPPPIDYVKGSGGIFLDMTIHDFDMARFLIGSEVEEVYASGGVLIDPAIGDAGDIDTCMVQLKFVNGTLGTIENSRQAVYGYDQRAEVFGSRGSVEASNNRPRNTVVRTVEGIETPKPLWFFLERYMDSYVQEMRSFIHALQSDQPPPVSGIDGRIPVVMGLAATLSYRENRPVRLEEIGYESA